MTQLPPQSAYPRKIYIKSETYRIQFTKKIQHFGDTDPERRLIRIKHGMSRREIFTTFIHEALHAMAFEGGFKLRHKTVYRLEETISELLLDNFL